MITDSSQARSLLDRMTGETAEPADPKDFVLTDHQLTTIVEVMVFRLLSQSPGMDKAVSCEMERTSTGWIFRVDRK